MGAKEWGGRRKGRQKGPVQQRLCVLCTPGAPNVKAGSEYTDCTHVQYNV